MSWADSFSDLELSFRDQYVVPVTSHLYSRSNVHLSQMAVPAWPWWAKIASQSHVTCVSVCSL